MTRQKLLGIRVRLTKEQLQLIKNKANYYGFTSMSAYIRDATLKDIYYVQMLKEIHEKVCGKKDRESDEYCPIV